MMRRLISLSVLLATFTPISAASPDIERQYYCDVRVISIVPNQGIRSVKGTGHGGVGPNGKVTLGHTFAERRFNVIVDGVKSRERFEVKVSVEPHKDDKRTTAITEKMIDLTDLQPQVVDIAKDDDGRVYRVNLYPYVISRPLPKQFDPAELRLDVWKFRGSQVILNRTDLLGEMNMYGAAIGYVDIAGVAKVEFSLNHLKGAEADGVLKDGTIEIKHDDQVLVITNVSNGRAGAELKGGPYKVWVRWLDPSKTIEEYRVQMKGHLETIKAEIAAGHRDSPPAGTLERLQKAVDSDRVLMLSSGMGAIRKGDLQD